MVCAHPSTTVRCFVDPDQYRDVAVESERKSYHSSVRVHRIGRCLVER